MIDYIFTDKDTEFLKREREFDMGETKSIFDNQCMINQYMIMTRDFLFFIIFVVCKGYQLNFVIYMVF